MGYITMQNEAYHYTDCGLDNVYIEGFDLVCDDSGEETICIPAIGRLHKAIAQSIVMMPCPISGKELRFLRTEMGYTQKELADILKTSEQTLARWEKGQTSIPGAADILIRKLTGEKLGFDRDEGVESIAGKIRKERDACPELRIQTETGRDYRPVAA